MQDSKPHEITRPGIRHFSSFEDEIASDIESIVKGSLSLYDVDRFRQRKISIDVYFPRIDYPLGKQLLHNPDSVRFQLSLCPDDADLSLIHSIVLKPRHIESGGVELMALYMRETKTLVLYLHLPHNFSAEESISSAYNEFVPYEKSRLINRSFLR